MKMIRVLHDGQPVWGLVQANDVHALDSDRFVLPRVGRRLGALSELKILAPLDPTNQLVMLLSNWRGRDNRDGPCFFVKPRSTLINPGEPIIYPRLGVRVDFEAEIAVIIGRTCRNVAPEDVPRYVLGYTIFNDVTAFEVSVATNLSWLYGKSFDTFGSAGPWIDTDIDPDNQPLRAWVNGEIKCDTHTSRMNWNTREVVSWISQVMTLNPGDLVSCGSPPEHAPIKPGDRVVIGIEGIGNLENPVVAA